mmetsp:Transcript_14372/g.20919  ORF Transcript_14372/g.20919 Transcript_14372/m.20919 type:complete len:154 (-) Transcript_14372:740-1201(-)
MFLCFMVLADTPFTSKRNTDLRNHLLQSDFWKTLKAVLPNARALCLLQAVCETRNINGGIVARTFWWMRSVVLDQADLTSEENAALTERIDHQMEECLRREDYVAWLVDPRLCGVGLSSAQKYKIISHAKVRYFSKHSLPVGSRRCWNWYRRK